MSNTFRPILLALTVSAVASAADAQALDELAFMSGCWRSSPDSHGTLLEENYTPPSRNLMLGASRFLRGDSAVSFEFSTISRDAAGITLHPRPNGSGEAKFRLARLDGMDASFENPAHDFPQRIRYRRDGDALIARIEDMGGRGMEWRMSACPRPPGT